VRSDESGESATAASGGDPLELKSVVVHGYERAYRMAGQGPAVLFIHGIGDDSATWLSVLDRLTDGFTVIAPDLLGHGGSARPRADYSVAAYACGMRDLLAALGIERVTVVGHSLGGGVAMQFAYQFPDRCERLVLVGSGGVGPGVHPLLRIAAAPGADLFMPLVGSPPVRMLLRTFSDPLRRLGGMGLGDDLTYVIDKYTRLLEPESRQSFLRTLRSVVDWRGQVVSMLDRCYLAEGVPTMLIWGSRDRVIPASHAAAAHRAMPDSRLEVFEGAGHFPHHTDPDRFLAVLREFLAETDPAGYDVGRWRRLLRSGGRRRIADDELLELPPISNGA
jgi:pimeloyl-ACP methyl ester carboxylesterase